MSWTVRVRLDPDKDDVGMVEAVWNAEQADEFRYGRRVHATGADANAFVSEAVGALTAREARAALEATYASTLSGLLNA